MKPKAPKPPSSKYLWDHYGITQEQWLMMWKQQKGVCKICLRAPKIRPLQVDHCHKTGRVRGLICVRDNHRLLGRGLESPWLHQQAALYLLSDFDGRNLKTGDSDGRLLKA